jgi:hypothetical protein
MNKSRTVRHGVDQATQYRPYKIMHPNYLILFMITNSLTIFTFLSSLFSMFVNSVWHLVTPFTDISSSFRIVLPRSCARKIWVYIYESLILSCHILLQLTLLAILNVVIGALKLAMNVLHCLCFVHYTFHRITSYHVQIFNNPLLPSQQLKSAFVSYISFDQSLTKPRKEISSAPLLESEFCSRFQNHFGVLQNNLYFEDEIDDFNYEEDFILIPGHAEDIDFESAKAFTAYKKVDRKIKLVSGTFLQDALVKRTFPHDPLEGLTILSKNPPEFIPTEQITNDRFSQLNINSMGFLWPEEEKIFIQVLLANEKALAFEETNQGNFREDYFSPYIMPTIPHTAWEERNIPIPPGIRDKVIEVLKHKMDAGVYQHCQSPYQSKWFCVLKKIGKLRIVHDLQALNAITI